MGLSPSLNSNCSILEIRRSEVFPLSRSRGGLAPAAEAAPQTESEWRLSGFEFRLEETSRLSAAALCARSYRGAAALSPLSSVTPRRHSVAFKLAASDPTLDQFSALSQAISQSEPPTRDSLTKLSSAGREAA